MVVLLCVAKRRQRRRFYGHRPSLAQLPPPQSGVARAESTTTAVLFTMSVVSTVSSKARGLRPRDAAQTPPLRGEQTRQKQTGAAPKDRAGSEPWPRKVPSDAEADVLRSETRRLYHSTHDSPTNRPRNRL